MREVPVRMRSRVPVPVPVLDAAGDSWGEILQGCAGKGVRGVMKECLRFHRCWQTLSSLGKTRGFGFDFGAVRVE